MSTDDRDDSRPTAVERYAPATERTAIKDDVAPDHVGPFYKREKEMRGPCLALTLKLKNGNRKTIEYAHRTEMDFDPELGIEMYFSTGVKITIKGQYLQKLYDDLADHRVIEIISLETLHAYSEHRSEITGKHAPLIEDVIVERGTLDVDSGVWKAAAGAWNSKNQQWQPTGLLN